MLDYLNSFLCLAGIVMCTCRLGSKMSKQTTKGVIRLQYVMWLGMLMLLLLERPIDGRHIIMSGVIVAYLLLTLPAWKNGPPQHALKGNQ